MTEDHIREAGRRLGHAWRDARATDAWPEALRARSRTEAAVTDPQPVRAGSVVRARFGTLGAIDIEFVD